MSSEAGKGDKRRPSKVSDKQLKKSYEDTFRKKCKKNPKCYICKCGEEDEKRDNNNS